MAQPAYYEYIRSPEWRQKANAAKLRARHRCQVCNRSSNEVTLDTHHRTYERLGNESPEDLTVLCRDCHQIYESQKKLPVPPAESSTTATSEYTSPQGVPSNARIDSKSDHVERSGGITPPPQVNPLSPDRHMLVWLGKMVMVMGFAGIMVVGFRATLYRWSDNPLFVVFDRFQVVAMFRAFTTGLYWQFILVIGIGWLLFRLAERIVSSLVPATGAAHWYWKWGTTAIIKVPLFLLLSATAALTLWQIGIVAIAELSSPPETTSLYLVAVAIFSLYFTLLPLPALHLTWDNKYVRIGNWKRLAISIALMVVILGASVFTSWVVNDGLCKKGLLLPEEQCRALGLAPANPEFASKTASKSVAERVLIDEWKTVTTSSGALRLDIPAEWDTQIDVDGMADFGVNSGKGQTGIGVIWREEETGTEIANRIERHREDPNSLKKDFEEMRNSIMAGDGSELLELVDPYVINRNGADFLADEMVLLAPEKSAQPTRLLNIHYDCTDKYSCQLTYIRTGQEDFTEAEWRLVNRTLESLELRDVETSSSKPSIIEMQSDVTELLNGDWHTVSAQSQGVQAEIPEDWNIVYEDDSVVTIEGTQWTRMEVEWIPQDSGTYIADDVTAMQQATEASDAIVEKWEAFNDRQARAMWPDILEFSGPLIVNEDGLTAIYYDVLGAKDSDTDTPIRNIVLHQDCSTDFICVVAYYRLGEREMSADEWRLLRRIAASIELHDRQ